CRARPARPGPGDHPPPDAPRLRGVGCKLGMGKRRGGGGGQALAEVADSLQLRRGTLVLATDPSTLVVLWPVETAADLESARQFVTDLQEQVAQRAGQLGARVRAGIGGYHPGFHGVARSYLEAQQAFEAGRKLRPDSVMHGHDE